ncbi:MAG: MFS transporter [Pseudomonadota bacterium]
MLPSERRAVGLVALIAVLRMFGLFALLPVLALYAAGLDGATPLLVGVAVGGYGLTQAGLQVPMGALSDRIGRLPVIVGGLLIFAAGSLLAASSDTIQGVIAGRLLQGAGAISATLTALLSDVTRPAVRTRSMAVLGVGIGAAFLLALIAGPSIAAVTGTRALFVIAAAVAIVAALLALALPRPPADTAPARRGPLAAALRPELLRLDVYVLLLHALLTALFVALPFVLTDRLDLPLVDHWQVYVTALLLSLVGTVPLIIADDRRGKQGTILAALLLLFVGVCLLTFASVNQALVVGALAIFFAGFNFLEAGLPARLSLLASAGARGASLGVFSSAQFLGAFLGGVGAGVLLSAGRPTDVLLAAAVLTAIWLAAHGWPRATRNVADSPEI